MALLVARISQKILFRMVNGFLTEMCQYVKAFCHKSINFAFGLKQWSQTAFHLLLDVSLVVHTGFKWQNCP